VKPPEATEVEMARQRQAQLKKGKTMTRREREDAVKAAVKARQMKLTQCINPTDPFEFLEPIREGEPCGMERFHVLRRGYYKRLLERHGTMEDAITGNKLSTVTQLISLTIKSGEAQDQENVTGLQYADYTSATDVGSLARLTMEASPSPVLFVAPPGFGKTWSANQLTYKMAEECSKAQDKMPPPTGPPPTWSERDWQDYGPLSKQLVERKNWKDRGPPIVPFMLTVQDLARISKSRAEMKLDRPTLQSNAVLTFLDMIGRKTAKESGASKYLPAAAKLEKDDYYLLMAAYHMRLLVVVVDGIDEAPTIKDRIKETLGLLVQNGICVVATTRPEGVSGQLREYAKDFVIANLAELSDEQQLNMVKKQLGEQNAEFFEHLIAFTQIRKGHDLVYVNVFETEEEREHIESFETPNRQFINGRDGERDKHMRQKRADGEYCVVSAGSQPTSTYLKKIRSLVTDQVLGQIDDLLVTQIPDLQDSSGSYRPLTDEELKAKAVGLIDDADEKIVDSTRESARSICGRLALLVRKRRKVLGWVDQPTTPRGQVNADQALTSLTYLRKAAPETLAASLWPVIIKRTDQIYAVAEGLLSVFHAAMKALAKKVQLDPDKDLLLADKLKDPVRLHEKALDDYVLDFNDWDQAPFPIPESCVIDVLRGRVVCPETKKVFQLLAEIAKGFEVEIEPGKIARLSIQRAKNKFANGGRVDPTHFRNVLINLILEYDGVRVVTELQIHHQSIFNHNEQMHAHLHYEFFRSLLAGTYEQDLDAMLERLITFLDEVSGTPVLLSMLVLVFKFRDANSAEPLPANRYELYAMAIRYTIEHAAGGDEKRARDIREMLSSIALKAHMQRIRDFDMDFIAKHVSSPVRNLFESMAGEVAGLPLVKTLEAGTLYRYSHISFQEAFFAMAVIEGVIGEDTWPAVDMLSVEYYVNVFRIGGVKLGPVVAAQLRHRDTRELLDLNQFGITSLLQCMPDALMPPSWAAFEQPAVPLERLNLSDYKLSEEDVERLAPWLVDAKALQELRMDIPVSFEPKVARKLASVCAHTKSVVLLGDFPLKKGSRLKDADAILIMATLLTFARSEPTRKALIERGWSAIIKHIQPKAHEAGVSLAYDTDGPRVYVDVDASANVRLCTLAEVAGGVEHLKGASHRPPATHMRLAGYTAKHLRAGGYSAAQCKQVNYTLAALCDGGFPARECIQLGYSARELHAAGFTAQQCKGAQVPAKEAGFTCAECRVERFSAAESTAAGFGPNELKEGGYTSRECKAAAVSAKAAGFSCADCRIGGFTAAECTLLGYAPGELKVGGYSALECKEAAVSAKEAGYPCGDCRVGGYSAHECKQLGYSPKELKAGGYTPRECRQAKVGTVPAGFSVAECRDDGFKAEDCIKEMFSPLALKAGGFSAQDCKAAKVSAKEAGFSAAEASGEGFSAAECAVAGFTPAELKTGGYTAQALKAANVPACEAGFSVNDCRKENFSAADCKAACFSPAALKTGGFKAQECKAIEVSAKEAGFTAAEVKKEGFTPAECKLAGYAAAQLKPVGFSAIELKQGGYGAGDLISANFKLPILVRECEFEPKDLREGGATADSLFKASLCTTPEEFFKAGFPAQEVMRATRWKHDQMRAGGYSI